MRGMLIVADPYLLRPLLSCGIESFSVSRMPEGISRETVKSKEQVLVPWTERAGSLPLTRFWRHDVGIPNHEESDAWFHIIDILDRCASRWNALYYQGQELILHRFGDPSRQTPHYFIKWDSLQRIYGDVGPREIIPWPQFTHLEIRNHLSCRDAVDIFKGCPKLIVNLLRSRTTNCSRRAHVSHYFT